MQLAEKTKAPKGSSLHSPRLVIGICGWIYVGGVAGHRAGNNGGMISVIHLLFFLLTRLGQVLFNRKMA